MYIEMPLTFRNVSYVKRKFERLSYLFCEDIKIPIRKKSFNVIY